jgi:hypothetical protein
MPSHRFTLRDQQQALTRHLRDPQKYPPPAGMDPKRVGIYRELVPASLMSVLSVTFPVLVSTLGAEKWRVLVKRFLRDYRSHTPKFGEVARHFVAFLAVLEPAGTPVGLWRPYIADLAHYEWVEMALMQSAAQPFFTDGAVPVLERRLRVSPLAWPLAYIWPVHRIGPGYEAGEPPRQPTFLLVRRLPDGSVKFAELSPLAWHLLHCIEESPALPAGDLLEQLGKEAQAPDFPAFIQAGQELLMRMHTDGIVAAVHHGP